MRAGNLNKKITFQNLGNTPNEFGEITDSEYSDYKLAYASIVPISGNENFLSNADFSKVTHKIEVRYFDGLNASMIIKYGNRTFKIVSVINPREANKMYQIKAEENIND